MSTLPFTTEGSAELEQSQAKSTSVTSLVPRY